MTTVTDKRSRRERARTGDLAWWERFMFSFLGPPQLGENKVREGYVRDAAADLCGKCGQPWDIHQRVRTSNMTYTKCPTATG